MLVSIIDFILEIAKFSRIFLFYIFLFNLLLFIYWLYHSIWCKETVLTLESNIFYVVARSNDGSFLLSGKDKEQAEKSAEHHKTFLRILFFLIFIDMCAYTPFRFFYKQDLWYSYLLEYTYIFWSLRCLSKIKNDRWYAFPLIINPVKRFRFRKRYHNFIETAYKFFYFEDSCNMILDEILDEFSVQVKAWYDWLSCKNISGEDAFFKNVLIHILKNKCLDKKISESEVDRLVEKMLSEG